MGNGQLCSHLSLSMKCVVCILALILETLLKDSTCFLLQSTAQQCYAKEMDTERSIYIH